MQLLGIDVPDRLVIGTVLTLVGILGADEVIDLGGDAPVVSEYPWKLVRSCGDEYSYTLFNQHSGAVYRDYYGPAFEPDTGARTAGFRLVPRADEGEL